jgi:hypothetical protein
VGRVHVPWVRERLCAECIPLLELADAVAHEENPAELLHQLTQTGFAPSDTWVVLDGYHFTLACQHAVRDAGYHLLVIDDYAHLPEYSCDILLNQNLGAETLSYMGDIGRDFWAPAMPCCAGSFVKQENVCRTLSETSRPKTFWLRLAAEILLSILKI